MIAAAAPGTVDGIVTVVLAVTINSVHPQSERSSRDG